MAETIYVVPRAGLLVADPDARGGSRHLPAEGATVPDTPYWRRRLRGGDVSLGRPPKLAKSAKPAPKTDEA
ncbi:DUF2635 domain-containing protein [Roseospirillum parvum]|uniref:DUF2635 domain-containing protein n=1 Tax=Roseospirillum parvum TaxID=83401 RepID=A0A1G8G309_9PROT|nr:DUF2635 domain-containing protein [Roseospirillum parvum]SDH88690.1 Protein of unknown function [Roseospirillum parvum]